MIRRRRLRPFPEQCIRQPDGGRRRRWHIMCAPNEQPLHIPHIRRTPASVIVMNINGGRMCDSNAFTLRDIFFDLTIHNIRVPDNATCLWCGFASFSWGLGWFLQLVLLSLYSSGCCWQRVTTATHGDTRLGRGRKPTHLCSAEVWAGMNFNTSALEDVCVCALHVNCTKQITSTRNCPI